MAASPSDIVPDSIQSIRNLGDVAALNRKFDWLKTARQPLENQWKLDLAFYKGRQYSYFNKSARRIESLPVEDGEKPRYRVRLVSNQIITGAQSLLAKLTKTKPEFYAEPGSGTDSDIKAAQVAQQLLEYWWQDFGLNDKLEEALLWSIIAGQGYWKVTWDAQASKALRFTLGPDGKPITDDKLQDLFRANLQQAGVQPQEKVVYLGDIKVEAISPFDVYVDPNAKNLDEAQYAFCVHNLTPDEVQARWKKEVPADSISSVPDTTLPMQNAADARKPDTVRVLIGYFKPSPTLPNGRYVVWTKTEILEDSKWPYPFNELPLVKFPGLRVPGQFYDSSVVEHAIPLQKELNRTLSQIIEYKNLTVKPRVWAPTGSITTRLTSEPGALYEYNPIGDHKPEVEKLPTMPPYVFDHLSNIKSAINDVFSLTQVSEGTLPPNVEAGIAIDLLQEMSTDRLAPTIKIMEEALAQAGQLMLTLAQQYYIEPRTIKINGASGGSAQVKRFQQADIEGGITIRAKTGSGLPRTRAGKQALIMSLVEKGIMPATQAYKHLDISDSNGIMAMMRADEDQALREHDKLINGEILNQEAYNNAQQIVQSGQPDPETGQPIQDPQQFLMNAGLKPKQFENYQTHMDSHALFMKSVEFESLPPQVQHLFIVHYNQTLQTFLSLPKPVEYKPVTPTMQIKTTVGPTAAAEILNKAGVYDITPQTMTEPPLDTWVNDDLSKPNANGSSNSPKDAVDAGGAVMEHMQGQEAHNANQAQLAELHHAKAREANAKADKATAEAARSAQGVIEASHKASLAERTAKEKRINPPKQPAAKKKKAK
jgi:hypothetical protein